jgi:type IV secretion system protein TrbL
MITKNTHVFFIAPLLVLMVILLCSDAANAASGINSDPFDVLVSKFQSQAALYGTALTDAAKRLFVICLTIDIALFGIAIALQRAQLGDIIYKFVMLLMFAGFIWSVIINYQLWSNKIINGLLNLSIQLGGTKLTMSPIKTAGLLFNQIIKSISLTEPIDSLGYIFCGLMILVCFALMTAQIILIKCESYLVINAATLLLGFGALGFLKEYALNTMRYALSVAFKLFVMQLLIGIGLTFFDGLTAISSEALSLDVLGIYVVAAIVLLRLTITIPDAAAGIINGSHSGGGHGMFATAAGVAAAVYTGMKAFGGATKGTSKGVQAVMNANKAGNQQFAASGGAMSGGVAGTARNLWQANRAAVHDKDSHGGTGSRMSAQLKTAAATGDRPRATNMPNTGNPSSGTSGTGTQEPLQACSNVSKAADEALKAKAAANAKASSEESEQRTA